MNNKKSDIIKILLNNSRVNNYTKLLLKLSVLDYLEDYYIPNKKLMNQLKIHKKNLIVLLHQLEEDKVIKIFYQNRKRYFTFIADMFNNEEETEERQNNIFDYNWLEIEEEEK